MLTGVIGVLYYLYLFSEPMRILGVPTFYADTTQVVSLMNIIVTLTFPVGPRFCTLTFDFLFNYPEMLLLSHSPTSF